LPNKQTVQPTFKSSDRFLAFTAFFVFTPFRSLVTSLFTLLFNASQTASRRPAAYGKSLPNGFATLIPVSLLRNLFLFSYFTCSSIPSMMNGHYR